MSAREELYAALMAGGYHSPARSERASERIDAYRAEVLREAAAWLNTKYGITNRAAGDLRRMADDTP